MKLRFKGHFRHLYSLRVRVLVAVFSKNLAMYLQRFPSQTEAGGYNPQQFYLTTLLHFASFAFLKFSDTAPENSSVCGDTCSYRKHKSLFKKKVRKAQHSTFLCRICHSSVQRLCFSGGKACLVLFLNLSVSQMVKTHRCEDLNGSD